jgi:hypothetical protein
MGLHYTVGPNENIGLHYNVGLHQPTDYTARTIIVGARGGAIG